MRLNVPAERSEMPAEPVELSYLPCSASRERNEPEAFRHFQMDSRPLAPHTVGGKGVETSVFKGYSPW